MKLSKIGEIVDNEINSIHKFYKNTVVIEKYIVMSDHIHMLIRLNSHFDEEGRAQLAPTISRIVQQFKGSITKKIKISIWQKLYYDHVIRDQTDYDKIWLYIENNPLAWELDENYIKE